MADAAAASNSTGTSRSCWVLDGYISLCSVCLSVVLVITLGGHFIHKAPPPQGPDIRLLSLHVSNFSVSNSQLRGTCYVGLKMNNPNKMDMSLKEFRVSILHGGVELARTSVQEPIPLERTKEKDLKLSMAMKTAGPPKLPKKVFAELEEEWSRRVVNFHVSMQVTVRFGASDSPPKSSKLFNLTCGQLRVFFYAQRKDAGRLAIGGGKNDCVADITGQE